MFGIYTSIKVYLIFIIVVVFVSANYSQTNPAPKNPSRTARIQPQDTIGNTKDAKLNFSGGNYQDALKQYLLLLKKDTSNSLLKYKVALCYLYTNMDKLRAIPLLESVVKKDKSNYDALYELGVAYKYANRFEDAINYFNKFRRELPKGKDYKDVPASLQIEMCYNAMELVRNPVNVTFENMGPYVNSEFPDYNPYVPGDESFLVYSSKRTGNMRGQEGIIQLDYDGYLMPDAYISYYKNHNWTKAKNFGGTFNSDLVEDVVGLSENGNMMFLYFDNYYGFGDIFISERKGKSFGKPEIGSYNINGKTLEMSASVTEDGQKLYFSSDLENLTGIKDIFISKKLPDGEWGTPVKLSKRINTEWDEDFPYITDDGKTLYFCSQGHNSMGGYDIFKSVWSNNENDWSEPVNIGYPINTIDDNKTISFNSDKRHGYISAFRPEGYGDLDIYRVTFNDIPPKPTLVSGFIVSQDSVNIVHKLKQIADTAVKDTLMKPFIKDLKVNIEINVSTKSTKKLVGTYKPNPVTAKYVMLLPPGEYNVEIKGEGFEKNICPLTIGDFEFYVPEIKKNLALPINKAPVFNFPKVQQNNDKQIK
ncbi:MAG: tetratricopeptide repeat protein [Bacteroidales bacterium]|nr:tetratricopeptide repeat protein [Bacteroidales bacterium]